MLDEENSIIDDTPRGPTNFVLVINPSKEGNVNINLKHINLRNLQLLDDGAWAFATFLQANSTIESVDFSFNCISDHGMQAIGHCISQIKNLHTLKLNGNGFGFDGCRYLQKSLNECKTINHLEVSGNRCGDDGAEIICQMIKFHESLEELYFDSNYVGNDGFIVLA
jgi:Ran GTPase-activating protein (RanGAP) involved in mRNA processing and transport